MIGMGRAITSTPQIQQTMPEIVYTNISGNYCNARLLDICICLYKIFANKNIMNGIKYLVMFGFFGRTNDSATPAKSNHGCAFLK